MGLASGSQTHLCFGFATWRMGLVAVPASRGGLSERIGREPRPDLSFLGRLSEKGKEGREGGKKSKQEAGSRRPLKGGNWRFWGVLCTRFGSQLCISCGPYNHMTGREAPRLSGGVVCLRSPSKLVAELGPTQPSARVELTPVWTHGKGLTGVT